MIIVLRSHLVSFELLDDVVDQGDYSEEDAKTIGCEFGHCENGKNTARLVVAGKDRTIEESSCDHIQ